MESSVTMIKLKKGQLVEWTGKDPSRGIVVSDLIVEFPDNRINSRLGYKIYWFAEKEIFFTSNNHPKLKLLTNGESDETR